MSQPWSHSVVLNTGPLHWEFSALTLMSLSIARHPCISLPIGNNGKPLAAIGKFHYTIGKLIIDKTLATNGEKIANAMIGNDVLTIHW